MSNRTPAGTSPVTLALSLGLLLLPAVAPEAGAQSRTIAPGETVRLFVRGEPEAQSGTLLAASPAELRLRRPDGSVWVFASSRVERAEVRVGSRGYTLRGALIGGAAGMVAGLIVGATSQEECDPGSAGFCTADEASVDWAGLWYFPVAGAGAGGLIGALMRSDRWAPAIVPPSPGMGRALELRWTLPVHW